MSQDSTLHLGLLVYAALAIGVFAYVIVCYGTLYSFSLVLTFGRKTSTKPTKAHFLLFLDHFSLDGLELSVAIIG